MGSVIARMKKSPREESGKEKSDDEVNTPTNTSPSKDQMESEAPINHRVFHHQYRDQKYSNALNEIMAARSREPGKSTTSTKNKAKMTASGTMTEPPPSS